MKAVIFAAAVTAKLVTAHYTFPDLITNGVVTADWQYVRETANHYSNAPVTSVTDPEFRCYELDLVNTAGETGTATVAAGSTIGFKANGAIYHPGYLDVYMTPAVPAANSAQAGTGQTWFKVWEDAPTYSNGQLTFPSESMTEFTFTIPPSLPSGQYLVRGEQIALHVASTYGGAQASDYSSHHELKANFNFEGCAQIEVTGGGSGTPGPLVSIPGVYTGYEPGILINIYNLPANFTGYQAPGPAVWRG